MVIRSLSHSPIDGAAVRPTFTFRVEPRQPAWHAEYTDGRSAVVTPVVLSFEAAQIHILDAEHGSRRATWELAGSVLDELQEGVTHLHSALAPTEMLTIRDPGLAAFLRERVRQVKRLPGGKGRLRFAAFASVAIAALSGGFYASVPVVARWIARQVPLAYERQLGSAMLPLLTSSYCDSEAAARALGVLQARLDPGHEVRAELHVLESELVNAFALPGGVVVLTEGLLQKAKSADEVAGVLAHELEHVKQRHVLTHMVRASLLTTAWSIAVGDYAGLMLLDPTTAFEVANLRHSRDDEAEADAGAADRLDASGISRHGLVDFFERIKEETDKIPVWLSNHPTSAARAQTLGGGTSDDRKLDPALTEAEFTDLRNACRANSN
jgi:Zn-dependent protease with chaperone function